MVSHVAPHLNHLNLMNAVVPLMRAPCDINAGARCHVTQTLETLVSHEQKVMSPCFSCLDLTNAMVPLAKLSASCDAGTSGMTEKVMLYHV